MRVDRAREAALDALAACRRNGAWIDGALKQVLKRDGLSGRDAAFASRIAYGVMQSRIYLDRCLARCLTQRPEKLEPLLLDILRIGAYQILLMDKVPVNAAVNEAVEMAKAHKLSRAAGLVNAVLRNVDRRRGEPLAFADELEALSVQTSHPRALVERVVGLLGAEEAEAFLRADNEPVPTTIQTNTLKTTAKRLRASLEDEGVTVEPHPWLADCFTVSGTGDLEGLRGHVIGERTGKFDEQHRRSGGSARVARGLVHGAGCRGEADGFGCCAEGGELCHRYLRRPRREVLRHGDVHGRERTHSLLRYGGAQAAAHGGRCGAAGDRVHGGPLGRWPCLR